MSKYANRKAVADNITFHSTVERDRYLHLKLLQQAGEISDLKLQPLFEVIPKQKGEQATKYKADFSYMEGIRFVVEDVKSDVTIKLPDYIMKRKLMLKVHGIKVRQILMKKSKWVEA